MVQPNFDKKKKHVKELFLLNKHLNKHVLETVVLKY